MTDPSGDGGGTWRFDDLRALYVVPGSRLGRARQHFTNRNTTFATWNLMHLGAMLKRAGGVPAHGNQRSEWDAGCRFDYENPEHR
jgi:hypothetical protein